MLQHLKDPVGALVQAARIADAVVVTETDWMPGRYDDLQGMILFESDSPYAWYQVKPPLIKAVLSRMGFGEFTVEFHKQAGSIGERYGVQVPHFTVAGRYVIP